MVNSSIKDVLERLYNWIDVLEKRVHALLDTNDPELMSPAQRERAASRHLVSLLYLLQLRQKFAESIEEENDEDLEALMRDDETDFDMESSY